MIPKKQGPPEGQHLDAAEQTAIRTWHEAGVSGREIARRLKKPPGTVQKAIKRMGLPPRRPRARQQDALLEYGFEEEDQLRETPNPAWSRVDKAWKKARRAASKLKAPYAELTLPAGSRATWRCENPSTRTLCRST